MIYTPYSYQDHADQHVMDNPYAGLLLDMGLGKTVISLTAANRLLYEEMEISKVLVIAPKKVAEDTWSIEADKWDHLKHLKVSVILGTEKQRIEALRVKADIYVINRENVVWLVSFLAGHWPFDMVIIDELSSFKSAKAARFKALRQVRPQMNRVVGLTGTPVPNGLIDLWPQMYLLDQGERLGKTISGYRQQYFNPGRSNGHVVYDYKLKKDSEEAIFSKISDICISMKAEDWLDLPQLVDQTVKVKLNPELKKQYNEFEKNQVLSLLDGGDISVANAAALSTKLRQFANGAVYTDKKPEYLEIHNAKLDALAEDLEALNGQPFLLAYSFKHDLDRIMKQLKSFKPRIYQGTADKFDWNRKKIPFMLAHPQSVAYGLNLQEGGNRLGWFGQTWSSELFLQFNARLLRQGQKETCFMRRYVAEGTIEEDMITAVDLKLDKQDALMQAVKARVKKYRKFIKT
jgi:SNF2 family DNA or RNA helicase